MVKYGKEVLEQEEILNQDNKDLVVNHIDINKTMSPKDEKTGKYKDVIQAIKFLLFSVSAGVIQIGSFTLLNEFVLGEEKAAISHFIALVLSVIWNFTINRKVTFKSSNNIVKSMILVALFNVVFTPASTWFMGWATGNGWNEYLVEGINMVANLVLEFLFMRFVVYRNSCDTAES